MKLALVMSLPLLELLADEFVRESGNDDDCQMLRQLTLSSFIAWVAKQQRETTNAKYDIEQGTTTTTRRFQRIDG